MCILTEARGQGCRELAAHFCCRSDAALEVPTLLLDTPAVSLIFSLSPLPLAVLGAVTAAGACVLVTAFV